MLPYVLSVSNLLQAQIRCLRVVDLELKSHAVLVQRHVSASKSTGVFYAASGEFFLIKLRNINI